MQKASDMIDRSHDRGRINTVAFSSSKIEDEAFVEWAMQSSEIRAEWVDGTVVMLPAVELRHARIVAFLSCLMGTFVDENELGEVLGSSYQIRFAKIRRRRMPDLIFISDAKSRLLQRTHFEGAPDLIVEVVSPETQTRDRREKFLEYQQVGVREYWIIDPLVKGVEFYTLKRKAYLAMEPVDGRINSVVLPSLFIRPEWFWQLRPPKVLGLMKQMG